VHRAGTAADRLDIRPFLHEHVAHDAGVGRLDDFQQRPRDEAAVGHHDHVEPAEEQRAHQHGQERQHRVQHSTR
jgi:hypothetical protein